MLTTDRSFPLRQWYVAGRSSELGRTPLARTICNEKLVLYRCEDGAPVVLSDMCPHRKYPLSKGALAGDDIVCGYHGLRFGADGHCTRIPTQTDIPRSIATRPFPVVERWDLVFVWMGPVAQADAALIPDFRENASEGWTTVHGYHYVEANWQLVVDNLLDLSHITFVHPSTLAAPGISENPLVVATEGDVVRARREMRNVPPAPFFRIMREFGGNIDRFQNIWFYPPNNVYIRAEASPAGMTDDPDLVHNVVLNHLTPETERTTHYFWSVARRMRLDDSNVSRLVYDMNRTAFDEDSLVLKRQQEMLDADRSATPLRYLSADDAAAAARRVVRRKLAEEHDNASSTAE